MKLFQRTRSHDAAGAIKSSICRGTTITIKSWANTCMKSIKSWFYFLLLLLRLSPSLLLMKIVHKWSKLAATNTCLLACTLCTSLFEFNYYCLFVISLLLLKFISSSAIKTCQYCDNFEIKILIKKAFCAQNYHKKTPLKLFNQELVCKSHRRHRRMKNKFSLN